MCGIWGYVGRDEDIPTEDAWRGLQELTDRGPDDWGIYTDTTGKVTEGDSLPAGNADVVLGNRRLSILDLSAAGNQPMVADDRYWLVYNGEVYNYRELRRDLVDRGYTFVSDSDTEVVLRAYQEYGRDCVDRFRGMFAFAIWDTETERLFAARDRLGIKPFYYDVTGNRLAFASEVTALLEAGVTAGKLDPVAVDGFLALGSVPAPRTILQDVSSLPPGTTMTYERSTGEIDTRRYWEPTFASDGTDVRNDPAERVSDLLEESVKLRMRSDVPVGAFLSGGLDSSAVVAAMTSVRDSDQPLHTLSIDFRNEEHSEGAFAKTVADALGTDHRSRTVTAADVRAELPAIVAQMDQPTVDGLNTYFVSQLAADQDLRVALTGLGSDELFYGYPSFQQVPTVARYARLAGRLPEPVRSTGATLIETFARHVGSARSQAFADALSSEDPFGGAYVAARGLFTGRQRRRLLDGRGYTDWGGEVGEAVATTLAASGDGDGVSHAELSWYMHNQLLRDTDVMSMAHSLEVRVPFLDEGLVAELASIPPSVKAEGEKALLKRAVSDRVPSSVLDREKSGFTFPFVDWLGDELSGVVDEALSAEQVAKTPLDPDAVADARQSYETGSLHWSRLWALVVLSLWIDEHL